MNAHIYLLQRTYINMVKRLFRKPLAAILTIFFLGCMIVPSIMRIIFDKGTGIPEFIDVMMGAGIFAYGYFIFYMIISQNNGLFYLADVNLMFTSPTSPKKNLVYALINIFLSGFLLSFLALIWLPLIGGKSLPFYAYILAGISFVTLMASIMLVYMYSYLKNIKSPGFTKTIKISSLIAILMLGLAFLLLLYKNNWDTVNTANQYFKSILYDLVPFFGWCKWGLTSALTGYYLTGWLPAFLLFVAFDSLLVYLIMKLDVDYYEQVQQDAEKTQAMRDKAKSGKMEASSFYAKKINNVQSSFGIGAKAIWSKHLLEFRKTGINMSQINSFIGIIYVALFSVLKFDYQFIAIMTVVSLIFTGLNDAWNADFKKPYIYLIPDSSMKKAFFTTLFSLIKTFISGAVAFTLLGVLNPTHITETIMIYFVFASFAAAGLYIIVFAQRFLGSQSNLFAINMLRMLFMLITAVPSGVSLVVLKLTIPNISNVFLFLPSIFINILISILLLFLSRRVFEVAELME